MGVEVGGAKGWKGAEQRHHEIQVNYFYFANKLFILLQHRIVVSLLNQEKNFRQHIPTRKLHILSNLKCLEFINSTTEMNKSCVKHNS